MHGSTHDLRKSISSQSTEQLLQMITVHSVDYRVEALDLARDELVQRGVELPIKISSTDAPRDTNSFDKPRTIRNTATQIADIVALISVVACIFALGKANSTIALPGLPLFPGALAGLFLSGHGGNLGVAYITAIVVNSFLYAVIWLAFRRLLRKCVEISAG